MKKKSINYKICASFDTETTTIHKNNEYHAFACLYIFAELKDIYLRDYKCGDETIEFFRTEDEAISYIQFLIDCGESNNFVPIVCAYNLMFDLQTIIYKLNVMYNMKVSAQSSTNVYTLDLFDINTDKILLRFWDTFHLEMRGLAAMGETCGLPKAVGDWDYTLVRTKETKLTKKELYYAGRDVQVIPAYLSYLLKSNEWLDESMLGSTVLTKTSLVRQMAKRQIAPLKNKDNRVGSMFFLLCKQEKPKTYAQYALRKACFRGGLTFTSANYANKVVDNVASLDVTSMHHTYINGRYIPVNFLYLTNIEMDKQIQRIINTDVDSVLKYFWCPFEFAIHARIKFTNLRLKDNTIFKKAGIAVIPQAKFRRVIKPRDDEPEPAKDAAEAEIINEGYFDSVIKPLFAYGKLMKADECILHLNEIELWVISQVYAFDSVNCLEGESTTKFIRPPDYVSLQSNLLFKMKSEVKNIVKNYKEGIPYDREISDNIPSGLSKGLKDGTISEQFVDGYYTSTVKGMFNGIYGTMAQDVYKPEFEVSDGIISINYDTVTNNSNWEDRQPKSLKVLYTYGMRIVAGSRMHLVISMLLLDKYFGDKIKITGGDTDSMKVSCDESITNDELSEALEPIAIASKKAIDVTQERIREIYPDIASTLDGIGSFDIEKCGDTYRYKKHIEYWNKARVSLDSNDKFHVTFAGLSRPEGIYNIDNALNDFIKAGYSIENILQKVLGYNIYVDNSICHALERTSPKSNDIYCDYVTDYLGNTYKVDSTEAIALYNVGRLLGDTLRVTNACNVNYNKHIYKDFRLLTIRDGVLTLWDGMEQRERMMQTAITRI